MHLCQSCGKNAKRFHIVDVPKGMALCDDCYAFAWACDSCERSFAPSSIEGGEDPGNPPLFAEVWCVDCCEKQVTECARCGADDLKEDMTETDDGLVCDACTRGHNVPEESAVVAFDNWRDAALQAIRELPEELQTSIGHSFNSDHSMLISVACEPDSDSYDEGRESSIATVHIRYQDSIWDQGRPVTEEEATSGSANYWASISVEANDTLDEFQGKFKCDRDLLMDFVRTVQTAILETMWSGGGMIDKDRKRRYFLPNGKRILDWK